MKKNRIGALQIGFTYIGVVVGAGFASGQEILRFFGVYRIYGLIGIICSSILFIFLGYLFMKTGHLHQATSHQEIINYLERKKTRTIIDILLSFFLFGGYTAMIAGSGAMINQFFNIPFIYGAMLMGLLVYITVYLGISGVITGISSIVPFLLIGLVVVSVLTVYQNYDQLINNLFITNEPNFEFIWRLLLYTAYNVTFSIGILASIGSYAKDLKSIKKGAVIGGIGLGFGAILIFLTIMTNINVSLNIEIPMLFFASKLSIIIGGLYSIILLSEIYSTAVGNLFAFAQRLIKTKKGYIYNLFILVITLISIMLSLFGFSNFVKYYYTFEGYIGLIILIIISFKLLKKA